MEEPALQSLSPSSLNPIHRLIGLLVLKPALLGFWFGTPEGDFLNALAGRETVEEDAGLEALCTALVEKLRRHPALDAARQRFEALKRKPYAELTAEEKQTLLALTQEIRSLSGRG